MVWSPTADPRPGCATGPGSCGWTLAKAPRLLRCSGPPCHPARGSAPGWAGLVVISEAVLITAPDQASAALIEHALSGVPVASVTSAQVLGRRLPIAEMRGPATLAYLDRRNWPGETAHLSVLTAPAARGRGLARAAASAAVAHAIESQKLPQWRARPEASRRVARALGFRQLGSQVSIRLGTAATPPAA